MKITAEKAVPYVVRQVCETCNKGELVFEREEIVWNQKVLRHVCMECGDRMVFKSKYPKVIHLPEGVEFDPKKYFDIQDRK